MASLDGSLNFEKFGENGSLHELIPRAAVDREPNEDPTVVKFDTPDTANEQTRSVKFS